MDTYSGSNDSHGSEPQDLWTEEETESLTADLGDAFANEDFQASQAAPTFDDSEYFIPAASFHAPQGMVPMLQTASQQDPEAYNPDLKLWYNSVPGPVAGAHYNRKIGWHFPRPAPDTIPQGPAMPDHSTSFTAPVVHRAHVHGPAGHLAAVAQVATFQPATSVRASAPRGRNPKKNSIIQRCSCKPQYSTIDIPRPPNQFICFRNRESMRVQQEAELNEGAKIRHDEVSKRVAAKWNVMTPEQKAPFKAQADRLAAEHKIKYPDWSFRPGVKAAHQFGSVSCTCGAYRINVAAREKRIASGEIGSPLKKKPGRKAKAEAVTLPAYDSYAGTPTNRKRKHRDEEDDEQPTPKRSTRAKTPVRYTESDDDNDGLFMLPGNYEMIDPAAEDDFEDDAIEVAPGLALPSKGRRSPPAPIATALASPPLTRSARKDPTLLKTASLDNLFDFDAIVDYTAPFEIPTSARSRSNMKSSGKGSVAPITPRRSTRLSSREAL
ncbi:hypothetical protein DOTSEDRAFT_31737 [Dothistroma septosporum NZE10]|uniref:HMG box domain-containing protein n=1 Tax=Dothistroma septosporum (strain NZE10 / CBS 128990) TaxID=675120 RepID=N1PV72_DOTSN|nr:hypothetical protein DOTSEDRAFT_31737 [Dothistroma septosporum NZE10]